MCGIFGVVLQNGSKTQCGELKDTLQRLFKFSESRGKESAGLHLYLPDKREAWTLKGAQPATQLIRSEEYYKIVNEYLPQAFSGAGLSAPIIVLAHSRLVTNGTAVLPENNQPVRSGHVTMIHNGIIVNVDEMWDEIPNIKRAAEVDTEVLAAYINDGLQRGLHAVDVTRNLFSTLKGAASVAWVSDDLLSLVLATNTGDLYYWRNSEDGLLVFASERYILEQALKISDDKLSEVTWVSPGSGLMVDLHDNSLNHFELLRDNHTLPPTPKAFDLPVKQTELLTQSSLTFDVFTSKVNDSLLRYNEERIQSLRRCSRCVLPETFPFIKFDTDGVCNYCHGYRPRYAGKTSEASRNAFVKSLEHYRSTTGAPDVIVPFSGGRDSSFGLHLIKKEFGFNPITFTYDWGMVTDLARRNIARMCGQLGVQNILVSADIKQKRANIRKNISAWLRRPDLGLVPLFMAGDKHFFSLVNQIKRQTGIRLDLWCANPLENTDFKSGFCGVAPDFEKKRLDYLSKSRKLRMAAHYGINFIKNPRYFNSSLFDTAKAFFAYYIEPRRDFYFMFDHMTWEENEVNNVLLGEYDWEIAKDTKSTWRIGDGTAPFYNYIYMTSKGFSEFDTFRSNQIREGMITREEAIKAIAVENRPRPESIKWYLDVVGLDFDSTIKKVNEMDTMGLHR